MKIENLDAQAIRSTDHSEKVAGKRAVPTRGCSLWYILFPD